MSSKKYQAQVFIAFSLYHSFLSHVEIGCFEPAETDNCPNSFGLFIEQNQGWVCFESISFDVLLELRSILIFNGRNFR
jgi:hypothetical protein